ncbi:MAG: LpqB family beta-propeller domain-containing protein [Acidobacteriota bacterium]
MNHRKYFFCLMLTLAMISSIALRQPTEAQTSANRAVTALPSFYEPAISPDRNEIAFVSGGDIWTVPTAGGEARLLVSHPATESRPLYSPDGKRLAFVSARTGNGDIYILNLSTGDLQRLTFDDAAEQLNNWSRDGKWLYFHSGSKEISGRGDIYRVSIDGGTPMQVTADRYTNEFFAAPAPDGSTLAFNARGNASAQWWRKGHSHLDESEIWLMREGEASTYERLTEGGAKELWAMWGVDGKNIYYVSDRSGAQNLWTRPLKGQARQLTQFKDGRVLYPTISYDGKTIVFERDFGIWKFDTANHQASEVNITRRGAASAAAVEHLTLTSQFNELALSPDGKKVAFIARGEIFAASAKDGGDGARVTNTPAPESHIVWLADSKRLVYASTRDGAPHLFLYDFAQNKETQLTNGASADTLPAVSPDGKMVAFVRDAKALRVIDLESKQERELATGFLDRPPFDPDRPIIWSPDSRWIAFMNVGERAFKNIQVVQAAGGTSKPISFLSNAFSNAMAWSPDGTYILFNSSQRTESPSLARIDLLPRTPKFREDQFTALFKDTTPRTQPPRTPAPQDNTPTAQPNKEEPKKDNSKNVEIVFEGINRRLNILPIGVDVNSFTISPDGKTLLMQASGSGQFNLYTYPLDELTRENAVARQLTTTPGFKTDAQFTPDGREVFYLEGGRINIITLDNRQSRPLAVTAEMDVDFAKEKHEVFRQAWTLLRDNFYDANFHGANWEAVRETFAPHIAGARTGDELRRLINLMVGELNASHLGINPPFNQAAQTSAVGRPGLRFDRATYEASGKLRITEVIALSPAAIANIKTGEYLIAVDGTTINARTNLDELLTNKVNRRVALTIAASADGATSREVAIKPVSNGTEAGLLYRDWVAKNRAYVDRASQGRLGYVHIPDMSDASLAQLYVDLDAENHRREGVVVDIRNNNGGFVNVYAIDVFARRGYITMTPRGYPSSPMRTMNGQRALELPTILITNQHSLSDAEDFTEGYRSLKLGKVVGEPTSGWIIYTWNLGLIDGSTFRVPRMKCEDSNGKNMELVPRPVDIPVSRPIGETYTDRDSQLDTAVRELTKQLGAKK